MAGGKHINVFVDIHCLSKSALFIFVSTTHRQKIRAMGKYRKRFNEKARSGMLAKQAKLKRARNKSYYQQLELEPGQDRESSLSQSETVNENTNLEILPIVSEAEKAERKRRLQEELYRDQPESKISRAKRKRLDKYIEHQLKRQEKKELFEKLAKTKVDTDKFTSSKVLGKGKMTKKEEMEEALDLEKQGRGDEWTKEVLYESRDVKEWDEFALDNSELDNSVVDNSETEGNVAGQGKQSNFVDNRPVGGNVGFGFSNIKKVVKKSVKKYSWRAQLEDHDKRAAKAEDEQDFLSDDEEEDDISDNEDNKDNDSDNEEDRSDEEDASEDDSEEIEEESEAEEETPKLMSLKPKHSSTAESFKAWAEEQIKQIEGRTETALPVLSEEIKAKYSKKHIRPEDMDDIQSDTEVSRETLYVTIDRSSQVQSLRSQLPVFNEEQSIMESIFRNDCVIICGETGSGKTTQVPQFLYEAGFGSVQSKEYSGMIGVTQPRRVAAVSMANRVKNEMGDHGHRVGYQIRFDSNIKGEGTENGTALKFMTDGVLLREMMKDFLLTKYSAIIIDEAHERNINTDILIGMLSRVLKLRRKKSNDDPQHYKPLKLIIMSATLKVADFSENVTLFKTPPPIINIEARQYPVSIHFSRHTSFDYQEEAFKKTCKIHQRLPPGGILIFMTGQNEINSMVKKLRDKFPFQRKVYDSKIETLIDTKNADYEVEDIDLGVDKKLEGEEEIDDYQQDSDEDEEGFEETLEDHQSQDDPLYVLPLYSLLPTDQQMKVFDEPPPGSRICIVATNVAETSLTIPGIRYVVDCGRSKERKYDKQSEIQSFEIDWISKASADQRSGRAGRTGPGHCYRLFSSAIYEDYFQQFSDAEILRTPVESTVLSMKAMGIDQVVNFPFPTAPERGNLDKAEKLLAILGALDKDKSITALGKSMAHFPLSPRFAKILIVGNQSGCLPYIIALVSALTVGDPFLGEQDIINSEMDDEQKKQAISKYKKSRLGFSKLDKSDGLVLLSAVCAFDHVAKSEQEEFIKTHFLRPRVMKEIAQLRNQITYIVKSNTKLETIAAVLQSSTLKLQVPTAKQVQNLKQIIASGFIDYIAIRSDLMGHVDIPKKSNIINIPYTSLVGPQDYVYIHPNSIVSELGQVPPDMVVYQLLHMSANNKTRMKLLVDISGKQLANISKGSPLLTYSKPLGNKYAPKNITPTKRECYVIPRFGAAVGTGNVGWDLPVIKVIQKKINGHWVIQ